MRLICPNCGAQYEVDARVIPDAGRDVQCSNCGHTWFQNPEHMDEELAEELGYEVTPSQGVDEENHASATEPQFDDEPEYVDPPEASAIAPEPEPIEDAVEAEMPAPARDTVLSDSVKDILRAEVEFDQSQRTSTPEPLETQPDLGLPEADNSNKSLRDRMARLRGLDPSDSGGGQLAAAMGKRRDLLPDIEEIKSTLNAASDRDEDGTVPDETTMQTRAKRSGFKGTFVFILIVIVLAIILYALAPILAKTVPALAPMLEAYVSFANGVRSTIDAIMASASARLNALLGQLSG